jgi:hypothetical protein
VRCSIVSYCARNSILIFIKFEDRDLIPELEMFNRAVLKLHFCVFCPSLTFCIMHSELILQNWYGEGTNFLTFQIISLGPLSCVEIRCFAMDYSLVLLNGIVIPNNSYAIYEYHARIIEYICAC